MVCDRCISSVKNTLHKLEIPYDDIQLGKAHMEVENEKLQVLKSLLEQEGFELLQDKNLETVEYIRAILIEQIHHSKEDLNINFSHFLSDKLAMDYSRLSKLFSETEGITIEKFIILQKIEKVKELIEYGESNFSEIAFQLGYSSSAYLSKQFKEVTGLTLTDYKNKPHKNRKKLDSI